MKKSADANKTNAARLLDAARIAYQLIAYGEDDAFLTGTEVARRIGADPAQVFKTLVCRGGSGAVCVFVVPVAAELDLKRAAKHASEKKIEMLPVKDILAVTGYIKGGCSPIGMKKRYPTFVDASARGQARIYCSAGRRGLQLELSPLDLLKAANASFADIAQDARPL